MVLMYITFTQCKVRVFRTHGVRCEHIEPTREQKPRSAITANTRYILSKNKELEMLIWRNGYGIVTAQKAYFRHSGVDFQSCV